ncbi:MAG: type II toxin-antitoxin system VapC family toxin [Chloroflexi bacterium]|nr:type II toxin-antitoxin system VapC family toxin [Chloroflexota bacterium]
MTDRPFYVVDASIVVRWYLRNEPYLAQALQVLEDYQENRINLLAPDNLRLEVAGAIRQAVTGRVVRPARGEQMLQDFLAWQIPMVAFSDLIMPAFQLSVRMGCSFYDAIYLTVAKEQQLPVIHADDRLRNALGNRFPLALWIEDYQPAR